MARRRLTDEEKREKEIAAILDAKEDEIREREREREQLEAEQETAIEGRLETLRIEHEARKRLNVEVTRQRPFELPKIGWTAEDFIAEEDEPLTEVIEGLHYSGNNTLLVAEFKAGKTTMEVNLAAALVDERPFLGKYATEFPEGNIAFLNYEMNADQFRLWLNDSDIERPERIIPLNLRGWTFPFWNEEEMLRLAKWLLDNRVKFIILDPAARAWRGLVEHEGDNVQLAEFFGSLDELKRLGDCPNLLIAVHKPREGGDRARGGGEIEAWPDGNWYLNKEKKQGLRTLRAEGRDIDLAPIDLEFDEETRRLGAAGSSEGRWLEIGVTRVVEAVTTQGRFDSKTELLSSIKGKSDEKRKWIEEAVRRGDVTATKNGQKTIYEKP